MNPLALGGATLASCLLFQRLPVLAHFQRALGYARKALRLILNTSVSDHWKERVLPRYAIRLALGSLGSFILVLAALAPFYLLLGIDLMVDMGFLDSMLSWPGIAWMMTVAAIYLGLARVGQRRASAKASAAVDASSYSLLSRTLHRLALGRPAQLELLFDIETATARKPPAVAAEGRHVFVSGLARAGTTVLMRAIHGSGGFASLTYRDMPFVMAPNLWARISARSRREMARTERAHGDGVYVDFDSAEALEEPFWRAFCGQEYIRADALVPHMVEGETVGKYRSFIAHVLTRYGQPRYLAKNNNNILRIKYLVRTFPKGHFIIPFRDPVAQAVSLHAQHMRFVESPDPFVRAYMTWLVHHEFGQAHRPYVFGGSRPAGEPHTIDYWLSMWILVYRHLLHEAEAGGPTMVPVAYEDLCNRDGTIWQALRRQIAIGSDQADFHTASVPPSPPVGAALLREAAILYGLLRDLSWARLEVRSVPQDRGPIVA